MKLRILLINPWIYDFAAADIWARPLGLLRVAECLSKFDIDLRFIDCTASGRAEKCGRRKYRKEVIEKPAPLGSVPRRFGRYGISLDDFREALSDCAPFDLIFMTSIMSYWYPGVQTAIEIIRDEWGSIPVVLGGTYATLWSEHAADTSGADFIYKGQITDDIAAVFRTFGFRIKRKREGETPYYRLAAYSLPFAPVLTAAGCPSRCSYCGSHILNPTFVRRDVCEVTTEIQELYSLGVRDFAFYDDALLVDADHHIKVILKRLIQCDLDIRFHCPNGLHARFIDDELASLMKRSGFRTLRLGFETADGARQKQMGGKVSSHELIDSVNTLKRQGFTRDDIGVYLMYGLPGQPFEEVRGGVGFLRSLDVKVHLTEFSPIPGTKCWEELSEKGIIADPFDPLLTNNTVFSYLFSGYDINEVAKLKLEVKEYNRTGA